MTDLVVAREVPAADDRYVRDRLTAPGRRIGRLVVRGANAMGYVVCVCDCGETLAAPAGRVADGAIYQCRSCSKHDAQTPARRLIGRRHYKGLMNRANGARRRCEDASHKNWDRYGGRGITWGFQSPEHYAVAVFVHGFSANSNLEVDRVDNDGPYAPDNIRLVSKKENVRNRENTFTFQGRPLADIAEENGLNGYVLYNSLKSAILRKAAETGSEPDLGFVLEQIERMKTRGTRSRPHSKKREPLMIEGLPALEVIAQFGLGGNKLAYDRVKDFIRYRRSQYITVADVRTYLAARFPDIALA